MTPSEAYTSLKQLYKNMILPQNPQAPKWTMAEIDQLDVHFFSDLIGTEEPEVKSYINDVF